MATDIFGKHICTYCQEEIKSLRVKCVECAIFELCLQCFSAGAEIGTHRKDHSYQFIDSVVCDVFRDRSGWSAREEIYLLNAIEHYSYGNWKDISEHIGTRTPEEARDEYINRFLGGDIGRHTWLPGLRSRCKLTDLTVGLEEDTQAINILQANNADTQQVAVDVKPEDAQQLDYMPFRDEYEVEFDNEAESVVSNLTLNMDDDELDIALKLTQVEIYTKKLRERARRHRIVQDNQLISQYFNNKDKSKKKMPREEKELGEKLRPLCKKQGQVVLVGVMQQRGLLRRLVEFMRYRRNGLVRLEEIQHFDQERQLKHNTKPGSTSCNTQHFSVGAKIKEKGEQTKSATSNYSTLECTDSEMSSETLANAHLLSASEKQLCSTLALTPTQYISMKTVMLVDPQQKTEGDCNQHVLDYLVTSGWVSNAATSTQS